MKHSIIHDEYHTIDFSPPNLFNHYLKLTQKGIQDYLLQKSSLYELSCPGCQNPNKKEAFNKLGLSYVECQACGTLYISPRPTSAAIKNFYKNSEARNYWRQKLSSETQTKRTEKIIIPRYQWILDSVQEYFPSAQTLLDIETEHPSYLETWDKNQFFQKKFLLHPLVNPAPYLNSFEILDTPLQHLKIKNKIDIISLFEVSDHASDIDLLFKTIHQMLTPNGLCFMTTILGSGFDLQTLWDHAPNLFPPDRLNVLTVEGLNHLFERHHFECLEFSTPGLLDIERVEKALELNPNIYISRFSKYLFKDNNKKLKEAFQIFLQENRLSSYGRILLRKKER